MVAERGPEDWTSEFGRFPRLFQGHESIPGLTWPTLTFNDRLTLYMGKRRVDLEFLGRAHTAGDIVAFVPDANVMFTGDIVEYHSACYCGDGHFADWWRHLLRACRPASTGYDDALAKAHGATLAQMHERQIMQTVLLDGRAPFLRMAEEAPQTRSARRAWPWQGQQSAGQRRQTRYKIPHNGPGGDVDAASPYYKQVRLLTRVLPLVAAETCFALRGGIRSEKISLCFQIVVICAAAALTNIGTKIFLRIVSVPNIYPSCAQSNGGLSLRTTNSPSARAAAGLAGVTRASATL